MDKSKKFGEILKLIKMLFEHPAAKRKQDVVNAIKQALDQERFFTEYPMHSDTLSSLLGKAPPKSTDDDRVPSAPKVKDERPDFDESTPAGEGPDFEEEVKSPPSKKETPALSAPSSGGRSKEEIVDKVYDLISQGTAYDMRGYAESLGVDVSRRANKNTVRKKIFEAFDIDITSMPKEKKSPGKETKEAPALEEVKPKEEVSDSVDEEPEEISEDQGAELEEVEYEPEDLQESFKTDKEPSTFSDGVSPQEELFDSQDEDEEEDGPSTIKEEKPSISKADRYKLEKQRRQEVYQNIEEEINPIIEKAVSPETDLDQLMEMLDDLDVDFDDKKNPMPETEDALREYLKNYYEKLKESEKQKFETQLVEEEYDKEKSQQPSVDFGDTNDEDLSDFDRKIYSPKMDKMLHGRGLEYPGWLVHEYNQGQITEDEGELLLEDYIQQKGLEDKKDRILQSFKSKIKQPEIKDDESEQRVKELDELFDLKLDSMEKSTDTSEPESESYRDIYDEEDLDEDPEFDLENDPDGENAAAFITYDEKLSQALAEQLASGYLEKNVDSLTPAKKKLLKSKGANSIVEYLKANLQMDKVQDRISDFFFENDIGPQLKDKAAVEPIIVELADALLKDVTYTQGGEPKGSYMSKLIKDLLFAESRKEQKKLEHEQAKKNKAESAEEKKSAPKKKNPKKKEASDFNQDDYLVNKMSGLNCKKIKIWASEINSMGTQRVVVKVGWNKDAAEDVYPWNISHAIRTYIHSLEAANYVQDENLGLIGNPRIVGLDLDKCEAKVIVSSTNAASFPPMLVEGTAAVERKIKI